MSFLRQFLGLNLWIRILILFTFIWSLIVFIFISKLNQPNSLDGGQEQNSYNQKINQILSTLELTKKKNDELKVVIDSFLR